MKNLCLLATDMDGTIIPLDKKKKRLEEIKYFKKLVNNKKIKLAYVTGRHLELALKGIFEYKLPYPHILVCDVGTSVYIKKNGNWHKDKTYRKKLKKSWKSYTGRDIAFFLRKMHSIKEQEKEKQKEFKQSYYVPLNMGKSRLINQLKSALAKKGVKANIIYSVDKKKKIGLLDLLPSFASKDSALRYLQKKLKIPKKNIAYAGDSGNDMEAFLSGYNSILVGNTRSSVKREAKTQARKKGISKRIYFASGYYVMGVIEGCRHYRIMGC